MTFKQVVSYFVGNAHDVSTVPQTNVPPKFFYVYAEGGRLYVSKARCHASRSCDISKERLINKNEFDDMLRIYHRRQMGESVSEEAKRITTNASYWYGIFNELKL